ncbi:hypothetical protein TI03_03990 [Achromatium sp. WMS1]|nr:hypothetical protein TI03_03990 [Achromatium sp. WMS1]
MALFATHLKVGVFITSILAIGAWFLNMANSVPLLFCWGLGVLGSILPDADVDRSRPARIGIGLLTIYITFVIISLLDEPILSINKTISTPIVLLGQDISSTVISIVIASVIFCLLYMVLFPMVTRVTIHRGLVHSVPAAVFMGLFIVNLATYAMQQTSQVAWLTGSFITIGFLVHLLLDEFYSIDWEGNRIKRSFGSAFKLWSKTTWMGTIALYITCGVLFITSPSPQPFFGFVTLCKYFRINVQHQQIV